MEKPDHCTAHSRRKSKISALVNSAVSLTTKIALDKSLHSLAEISSRYQKHSMDMQTVLLLLRYICEMKKIVNCISVKIRFFEIQKKLSRW